MEEKNMRSIAIKKRTVLSVITGVIVILLVILLIVLLIVPKRSVESYCKVYSEEKIRLSELPGDTYPSGVFKERVSNAGELATSFSRLERVAPDKIQPDVATLEATYEKIHADPSQAIAASLGGIGAEDSARKWTDQQCDL